jgi:hypothetical protein
MWKLRFATRAIHTGYDPADAEGALTPPVHLASTYVFDIVEHGAEVLAGTIIRKTFRRDGTAWLIKNSRSGRATDAAWLGLALRRIESNRRADHDGSCLSRCQRSFQGRKAL